MNSNSSAFRVESIDIFRALTMFLMIFVNDFWTLEGVPNWMEHTKAQEDAMGLSDAVFPCFLFIVGLSIPYAISNRRSKGDSDWVILLHIAERTFALLIMGIYIVNLENAVNEGMVISKYVWEIGMVVAFFLIWNVYKKNDVRFASLKVLGWVLLAALAFVYKGEDPANPSWMKTHWYGILGLIGWAYLIAGVLYFLMKDNLTLIAAGWLFMILFNIAQFAGLLEFLAPVRDKVWIVSGGSLPAFVMAGVTASVIYRNHKQNGGSGQAYILILLALGIVCFLIGFGTRPFWGISKIRATPAWVGICSGISFFAYAFFFWLIDLQHIKKWANIFKPAGTATLTCYLIPYIWYAVLALIGFSLPVFLRTGWIGLVKSLIFSLLVIVVTGLINRLGIRLKV